MGYKNYIQLMQLIILSWSNLRNQINNQNIFFNLKKSSLLDQARLNYNYYLLQLKLQEQRLPSCCLDQRSLYGVEIKSMLYIALHIDNAFTNSVFYIISA